MTIEPKPCTGIARGYWVTFNNGMKLCVTTAIVFEDEKPDYFWLERGLMSVMLLDQNEDFIPLHDEDQIGDGLVDFDAERRLTQAQVTELIDRLRAEPKAVATW